MKDVFEGYKGRLVSLSLNQTIKEVFIHPKDTDLKTVTVASSTIEEVNTDHIVFRGTKHPNMIHFIPYNLLYIRDPQSPPAF